MCAISSTLNKIVIKITYREEEMKKLLIALGLVASLAVNSGWFTEVNFDRHISARVNTKVTFPSGCQLGQAIQLLVRQLGSKTCLLKSGLSSAKEASRCAQDYRGTVTV